MKTLYRRNRPSRTLSFERFEERQVLAALAGVVVQDRMAGLVFEAGAQDVPVVQATIYGIGGKANLQGLTLRPQGNTNFRGIEDFDYHIDANNDGFYESVFRNIRPVGNTVQLRANLGVDARGVAVRVTADLLPNAAPQRFGVANVVTKMTTNIRLPWFGTRTLAIPTFTVGSPNPVHTIRQADRLLASELAGPTTDVVVENQQGIVFGRFTAAPSGNNPLLLTDVVYAATQGSVNNVGRWQLRADLDYNGSAETVLQDGATVHNGQIDFRNLANGGQSVARKTYFEVWGDAASSLTTDTLQMELAGLGVENNVGAPVHWEINHKAQTLVTFRDSGSVIVTSGATPILSHQVLGGAQSTTLASADVTALDENAGVYYVGIDVEGEGRSIDRIRVLRDGVVIGIATRGDAETGDDFGVHLAPGQLVVAEGTRARLALDALIKRDSEGGVSADVFALAVDEVLARGLVSSNEIDVEFPFGPVEGPDHTVVMSRVVRVDDNNSAPHGSAVPTGIVDAGQFVFTTADHMNTERGLNNSVIDVASFIVNAPNVLIDSSSFRFFNRADATSTSAVYTLERLDGSSITGPTVTGSFRVIVTGLTNSVVDTSMERNSRTTFALQMNVLNSQISSSLGSSLQVGILLGPGDGYWVDQEIAGLGLGGPVLSGYDLLQTVVYSTHYRN
jgi:hypothetical protein